jgi:hypothetical protein
MNKTMRHALILFCVCVTPCICLAQSYRWGDQGTYYRAPVGAVPLTADSLVVRPGTSGVPYGRSYDRLVLRGRIPSAGPPSSYRGTRQAGYFYFPHYPELSQRSVNAPRRPAIAPLPVYRPPFADPFYEERVLRGVLGDTSGYYPPW